MSTRIQETPAAREPDQQVREWRSLLKSPVFLYQMKRQPRDLLDDVEKQNLAEIAAHFGVESERPRKRPKTGGQKQHGKAAAPDAAKKLLNWGTITKIDRPVLAPVVTQHLEDNGTDAVAFLDMRLPYEEDEHGSVVQALFTHYDYTVGLSESTAKSQICALFTWLFWYDVLRVARADCTGSRVTPNMVSQMLEKLDATSGDEQQSECHGMLQAAESVANIAQWATFGMKLQKVFVGEFGIGSLFFLAHKLSENFMKNKITTQGEEHAAAMVHLKSIGLVEMVDSRRDVTELGENIRRCLRAPYQRMRVGAGGAD